MKILHVPYGFFPDTAGGTEVYVRMLAAEQQRLGYEVCVVAPGHADTTYAWDGLTVHRMAVPESIGIRSLYGGGVPSVTQRFADILDRERPDIVHLHALTPAVSHQLVRVSHRRGHRVVFTFHTPTATCLRGTLMRWGAEPCDGRLSSRCGSCALEARGLPRWLAALIGLVPDLGISSTRGPSILWTTLGIQTLVARLHESVSELLQTVDLIVAPKEWVVALLRENGVPRHRIFESAQPLCATQPPPRPIARRDGPIRLAAFGRLDPAKGLTLLARAAHRAAGAPFTLDFFVTALDVAPRAERARLIELIRADARLRLLPPVNTSDVLSVMAEYDWVAVPSQGFETGPLVVLEAQAAGAGVIGSRLGGIAELLKDAPRALLVDDFLSVQSWASALEAAAAGAPPDTSAPASVRTPRDVAQDMAAAYASLTGAPPHATGVIS